jgi:hypothetical protein
MSRPYATDEQYERWYLAECCRCGRRKNKAGSWPDGHVCRTCADRAVRTRGTCPGCGQERALPGRRPGDDAAICADCAGFSQSFACARCGFEGKLHGGRLCTRCALADRLADLLDDGSGRIRPELVPLADCLLAMDNPLSGLTWLYPCQGRSGSADDLLRRLGRGEIPLTHEAFNGLQPWRAASHLRDLLVSCGVNITPARPSAALCSKGAPNWVICRRRMRRHQRWFMCTKSAICPAADYLRRYHCGMFRCSRL